MRAVARVFALLVMLAPLAAAGCTGDQATRQSEGGLPAETASEAVQSDTIVAVSGGDVRGIRAGSLIIFKGIPYAAPPIGERRWRPPASVEPWQGILPALGYGNDCEQTRRDWDAARANEPMSEDCLTLNIWAPGEPIDGGAPVMVWLHGGSFTAGSGAQALYDGRRLASRGVIIVTINYRLGRFGFFAHPALTREANGGPTGNWGLMDQIAALRWVRDNIRAFGGNPENVTVFGESAGGGSVNLLMLSPAARGLFQRAIAQSGGGRDRLKSLAEAEAIGVAFARRAGANAGDGAALRAIPTDLVRGHMTMLTPESDTFPGVFVDGVIVVGDVDTLFAAGRQAPVPYLTGANSYEIGFLPPLMRWPFTALAARGLGEHGVEIRAAYGSSDAFDRNFIGDALFVEPARFLAGAAAANGSFLYHFDYVPEGLRSNTTGAAHASELPFVFGNLNEIGVAPTAADQTMADLMGDYWTAFARSGDPNSASRANWPRFQQGGSMITFGASGAVDTETDSRALDAIAQRAEATRPGAHITLKGE